MPRWERGMTEGEKGQESNGRVGGQRDWLLFCTGCLRLSLIPHSSRTQASTQASTQAQKSPESTTPAENPGPNPAPRVGEGKKLGYGDSSLEWGARSTRITISRQRRVSCCRSIAQRATGLTSRGPGDEIGLCSRSTETRAHATLRAYRHRATACRLPCLARPAWRRKHRIARPDDAVHSVTARQVSFPSTQYPLSLSHPRRCAEKCERRSSSLMSTTSSLPWRS